MKKAAVLLDAGFVINRMRFLGRKKFVTADEIYNFAKKCVLPDEELFRIYFYHCYPYEQTVVHPISGASIDFKASGTAMRQFMREMELKDYVAVRAGELSMDGWILTREATEALTKSPRPVVKEDFKPDMKQKRVDMKVGLDVAWLSSKKIVDRIILVTGDSDFVPAMKFARREGVQVILVPMGQSMLKHDLKAHADEIRAVRYP